MPKVHVNLPLGKTVWESGARGGQQVYFGPGTLPNFLERGNNQGGFGVSAVLPTSGTQTFIKNSHFLFYGCYAVPTRHTIYPGAGVPV